jgi:NAD(P)-dependent dehydrogenase (short-subunit alcohol dehydrogenase family)
MKYGQKDYWAVILGGSSGLGLASAKKLASCGMNLCLVHKDRRASMDAIQKEFDAIKATGVKLETFNTDALSKEGVTQVLTALADKLNGGKVRLVLHSIAAGNLRNLAPTKTDKSPEEKDFESLLGAEEINGTIHNMAISLVPWVQEIMKRKMFAADSRVIGLTSEGSRIAWNGYGAVACAKAALECLMRGLAREYGPHGIRCNIVQAGITPTPALKMIPGSDKMVESAIRRNPLGRLTTPEDVGNVISLLCSDEASWINGSILTADGGESISG